MPTDQRREIARQELKRAEKQAIELSFPPAHLDLMAAYVELVRNRKPTIDKSDRVALEILKRMRSMEAAAGFSPDNIIAGACYRRAKFNQYMPASIAFTLMAHLAVGARIARELGDPAWQIIANITNSFAVDIEGSYPNMADMLRESMDPRHDKSVPEHLLKPELK